MVMVLSLFSVSMGKMSTGLSETLWKKSLAIGASTEHGITVLRGYGDLATMVSIDPS